MKKLALVAALAGIGIHGPRGNLHRAAASPA